MGDIKAGPLQHPMWLPGASAAINSTIKDARQQRLTGGCFSFISNEVRGCEPAHQRASAE